MLTEFEGIIDSSGLRCFRQCKHLSSPAGHLKSGVSEVPFWAVLEVSAASEVLQEMLQGRRDRALKLLEENAFSIGSLPND